MAELNPGYWKTETVNGINYERCTVVTSDTSSATHTIAEKRTSNTEMAVLHVASDNGSGSWAQSMGAINYAGKSATLKVTMDGSATSYQSDSEDAASFEKINNLDSTYNDNDVQSTVGGSESSKGGSYGSTGVKEVYGSAGLMLKYSVAPAVAQNKTFTYTPNELVIDLCPYTRDRIVPGSVRFSLMGTVYDDFEGKIYRGRTSANPGIYSGVIDYEAGTVAMTDYVVGTGSFSLLSLWTSKAAWSTASIYFRAQLAPVKVNGLVLSVLDIAGNQIIATASLDGSFSGNHVNGKIDYQTGVTELLFGDKVADSSLTAAQKLEWWYDGKLDAAGKVWKPHPVDPTTLRYNSVSYAYLPLDAAIIGLDPVRLPSDGRVPIFRSGGVIVVHHTAKTAFPADAVSGHVLNVGRVRLAALRLIDSATTPAVINAAWYEADLDAGKVTLLPAYQTAGLTLPVIAEHRVEDMVLTSDVQTDGTLTLTRSITHDFPVSETLVSSALIIGDLQARATGLFSQATWTGAWSDARIGNATTAQFNVAQYPLVVTNRGAVQERWALIFTSSSAYQVVGESVGQVATGDLVSACAPVNPATGVPYFTIPALGWGGGWAAGNVLRFNTAAANHPVWIARTVLQGADSVTDGGFQLQIRGDIER